MAKNVKNVEPSWLKKSVPNSYGRVNLNPSEKASKYCVEMKNKTTYTNMGQAKVDKDTDKQHVMSDVEKAYRIGYVSAVNDSRMTYNKKNNPEKYKQDVQKKRQFWANRCKGGKK